MADYLHAVQFDAGFEYNFHSRSQPFRGTLAEIHIAVVFSLDGGGGCIGSVEGLGVFGPRKDSSRPGVGTADEHPWSFARAEIHTRMWMAKGLRKRRDILERL